MQCNYLKKLKQNKTTYIHKQVKSNTWRLNEVYSIVQNTKQNLDNWQQKYHKPNQAGFKHRNQIKCWFHLCSVFCFFSLSFPDHGVQATVQHQRGNASSGQTCSRRCAATPKWSFLGSDDGSILWPIAFAFGENLSQFWVWNIHNFSYHQCFGSLQSSI